jgi:NAD(P)-dependent dehydrogenase (short-subunit alcohol dehydrogenase family)
MNVLSMFDLKGEKAIVTGGGQGLGREMALALAEAGADVAVVQRRVEVAEQTAEEIIKLGRDSFAMKVDVRKAEDIRNMVAAAKDRFGKIDILINNAGIGQGVPALDMTEEDWDSMIDIHLKGTFLCSQMVGREMVKQKKGSIINIASMSGFIVNRPQPQAHYNAAKAGVVMLTKNLAMEWAKYNIRVNAIAPGYIKTPLLAQYLGPGKIGEEWVKLTPMGRLGEPFELKGLALFLASKASSFVTGATIVIDGGYTCW